MSAIPEELSGAGEGRGERGRALPALAGLAVLVLLSGLAWLGWGWLREPEEARPLLRDALERRFAAFEQQARRLELEAERRERRLQDLERVHRGLREDLLALRERLATIDRSLESLARRSQRAGELPVLLELEHLLAAAELRERALGDRRGAIALLAAAEELLRSRPEAALIELREMLAEDRRRLERLGAAAARAAAERRIAELLALAPALRGLDEERPGVGRGTTLRRAPRPAGARGARRRAPRADPSRAGRPPAFRARASPALGRGADRRRGGLRPRPGAAARAARGAFPSRGGGDAARPRAGRGARSAAAAGHRGGLPGARPAAGAGPPRAGAGSGARRPAPRDRAVSAYLRLLGLLLLGAAGAFAAQLLLEDPGSVRILFRGWRIELTAVTALALLAAALAAVAILVAAWGAARRIGQRRVMARAARGALALLEERHAEAERSLAGVPLRSPLGPPARIAAARAARARGLAERAERLLAPLAADPDFALRIRAERAAWLLRAGAHAEAIALLEGDRHRLSPAARRIACPGPGRKRPRGAGARAAARSWPARSAPSASRPWSSASGRRRSPRPRIARRSSSAGGGRRRRCAASRRWSWSGPSVSPSSAPKREAADEIEELHRQALGRSPGAALRAARVGAAGAPAPRSPSPGWRPIRSVRRRSPRSGCCAAPRSSGARPRTACVARSRPGPGPRPGRSSPGSTSSRTTATARCSVCRTPSPPCVSQGGLKPPARLLRRVQPEPERELRSAYGLPHLAGDA
ncbi:MAG: hypothetical protein RML12_11200 [Xanthomonadales bacterium]|nr:hypothetical protein [Xanthomonadales bacterium]